MVWTLDPVLKLRIVKGTRISNSFEVYAKWIYHLLKLNSLFFLLSHKGAVQNSILFFFYCKFVHIKGQIISEQKFSVSDKFQEMIELPTKSMDFVRFHWKFPNHAYGRNLNSSLSNPPFEYFCNVLSAWFYFKLNSFSLLRKVLSQTVGIELEQGHALVPPGQPSLY